MTTRISWQQKSKIIMGFNETRDTRVAMDRHTDRRTCLNGSKPPQVNAKCDVVMKLSVFGTRTDTHTHTRAKTYTSSLRGL